MKTVAISGGFDPLHVGHIRYIHEAKKLGDKLIVILNGDTFLLRKKGYLVFKAEERTELLLALKDVDEVFVYDSEKDDVCEALEYIQPDIFAKGGDRRPGGVPIPEVETCKKLGIEVIYGVGGIDKPNSSSWVIQKLFDFWRRKNVASM